LATGTNTCTSTVNLQLETIIYDALNLNPPIKSDLRISARRLYG
jgi:hypothetical protein